VEFILAILINKSLIKLDKDGIIRIHDQLYDMDRNIVKKKVEYKYLQI
uniref:Disease resistance protein Roq1-like winged-helix domain-containing protein n=1 Tax=Physcomitrium patens TaxID=3218 RepID=A0A7I3ZHU8_PHYPA